MAKQFTVEFCITESVMDNTIRIHSTNPTGVYVSTKDMQAGIQYFMKCLYDFMGTRHKSEIPPDQHLCVLHPPNWEEALRKGKGKVEFGIGEHDIQFLKPDTELEEQWFQKGDGEIICIISDKGEYVDDWLVEILHQDQPFR